MKPTHHAGQTRVLGAPPNWDADKKGPCEGLPVTLHDGVFYSVWLTTWRERLQILFGRPIRLCVHSTAGHPPVWIDTETKGWRA